LSNLWELELLGSFDSDLSRASIKCVEHLLHALAGTGPSSDADYARSRNIPKYVIDDIVTWIKKN